MIRWWKNTNNDVIVRKIFYEVHLKHVVSSYIGGPKLSSFKIEGPKLQKIENKWTKTAITYLIYI
jgi:hypothetical protein